MPVATQEDEAGGGGVEEAGVVAAMAEVVAVVVEDMGVVALAGVVDGLIPILHQWYV